MRFLAAILIIVTMGGCYAEAYEKGDWTVLGSLEVLEEGSKDRYTRDSGEDIRSGGNILRSFRRTAARLQEYDGLKANGAFKREGLDWTRRPLASQQTGEAQGGAEAKARTEESWGWSQETVIIPETAKNYMIFFTMEGCPACRTMFPIIRDLKDQGFDIYVIYHRTNVEMVNQHQVTSFPTMVIYSDGDQVKRYRGVVTPESITDYLQKPKAPDNSDRTRYDFVDGPSQYKLW